VSWPDEVERVAAVLREAVVEARVEEFRQGTPTAEAAARAAGCELEQIVKSLVFLCDDRPVLVMIPGDRRADRAKVQHQTGATRAKVAASDDVLRVTGFTAGGVAPFPLPAIATVLIDQGLLTHNVVWCGAGSPRHMMAIAPADLVRLSRARSADVAAELA
jgi:prolyl-tRNA editing enzyme YbaK/EbsC (Cys-tRNA(Pro) deacylase)